MFYGKGIKCKAWQSILLFFSATSLINSIIQEMELGAIRPRNHQCLQYGKCSKILNTFLFLFSGHVVYCKFRNFREGFSFVKINPLQHGQITLSFTDACK